MFSQMTSKTVFLKNDLKMALVTCRKLVIYNKCFKIITEFYSFIIIRRLQNENLIEKFRKVETLMKSNIKVYKK